MKTGKKQKTNRGSFTNSYLEGEKEFFPLLRQGTLKKGKVCISEYTILIRLMIKLLLATIEQEMSFFETLKK